MTCGVLLLIATTLRNEFGAAPADGLGSLIHAKSRVGSHISATPFGRYPPIVVARLVPTFWEVRRIRPMKVPFGFRAATDDDTSGSSPSSSPFVGESLLWLKRRLLKKLGDVLGDEGSSGKVGLCGPSLKMWMVSVADDTHNSVEVTLNDMLNIREGIEPRRN
jgi:hypothetical protein